MCCVIAAEYLGFNGEFTNVVYEIFKLLKFFEQLLRK